jgi:hypothetical protein
MASTLAQRSLPWVLKEEEESMGVVHGDGSDRRFFVLEWNGMEVSQPQLLEIAIADKRIILGIG